MGNWREISLAEASSLWEEATEPESGNTSVVRSGILAIRLRRLHEKVSGSAFSGGYRGLGSYLLPPVETWLWIGIHAFRGLWLPCSLCKMARSLSCGSKWKANMILTMPHSKKLGTSDLGAGRVFLSAPIFVSPLTSAIKGENEHSLPSAQVTWEWQCKFLAKLSLGCNFSCQGDLRDILLCSQSGLTASLHMLDLTQLSQKVFIVNWHMTKGIPRWMCSLRSRMSVNSWLEVSGTVPGTYTIYEGCYYLIYSKFQDLQLDNTSCSLCHSA